MNEASYYEEDGMENGKDSSCRVRRVHDTPSNCNRVKSKVVKIPLFELFLIKSMLPLSDNNFTFPNPGYETDVFFTCRCSYLSFP